VKIPKEFCRIRKRSRGTHKNDYGHVFVLAGSLGLTGAAYLCAQSAIRCGSGLVTLGIPHSLNVIMASKLTEVMTMPLAETNKGSLDLSSQGEILKFCDKVDVVAIGPGLSCNESTQVLVRNLVRMVNKPIVLDADGINAVSSEPGILKKIKKECVITPHPGEFSRLIRRSADVIKAQRKRLAREFADEYNITVVLKGDKTVVASPRVKGTYINSTGNPGMATAGCGDVLTGIIAGFIAQGLKPCNAAKLAVYLHGLTGDALADELGEAGLIASDLIEKLPHILKKFEE